MSISSSRKWRSSELIALEYLEKQGFRIEETRKKIKIEGVEIGEVDAIAISPGGEKYAVEIKAGRIDVAGIRQAYVNALLLGLKPLIVAKGYADDSAMMLARELDVKVVELGDQYLVDSEELEIIVESAIYGLLRKILGVVTSKEPIPPQDYTVIEALAGSRDIKEFADSLKTTAENAMRQVRRIQSKGILPEDTKSYYELKMYAQIILLRERIRGLERLLASNCREKTQPSYP
ncbi:endonuclease (RecB family)-like protein [Desulfurococcus amylolyticus 1221n]|uniref:Endonuclease (RecB family)-like protein n=1 Tax=Desulfurococcus amylolyticus (strain DSM 18924 / JCM 16383 / VKM B-2413 / 1221n) TaxID=490899 RepID=B8D4V0_DESA1|nr:recombinase RecB [Desulfurococcus amylolyticus]ACL11131.1 endonuclease (RecB family)-like protein [Desulfurococcus amylolyticus 1221n]